MELSARSIIVVGAGVFGVTGAMELRQRDYNVSLFDPGPLPRPEASSTDISKAVRMDYGDDTLYSGMAESCLRIWESWNQTSVARPKTCCIWRPNIPSLKYASRRHSSWE